MIPFPLSNSHYSATLASCEARRRSKSAEFGQAQKGSVAHAANLSLRHARSPTGKEPGMGNDLWQVSAVDLAAGIREKRFSCLAVMTSVVERIRALNPKLN